MGIISQSFSTEKNRNVVTALPISELKKTIELLSNNEPIMYLGGRGEDIASDLSQKKEFPKGFM